MSFKFALSEVVATPRFESGKRSELRSIYCVGDLAGQRCKDNSINVLTVIANVELSKVCTRPPNRVQRRWRRHWWTDYGQQIRDKINRQKSDQNCSRVPLPEIVLQSYLENYLITIQGIDDSNWYKNVFVVATVTMSTSPIPWFA